MLLKFKFGVGVGVKIKFEVRCGLKTQYRLNRLRLKMA
jgi:hypothetical protein